MGHGQGPAGADEGFVAMLQDVLADAEGLPGKCQVQTPQNVAAYTSLKTLL
jgi:hypothetical protein